MPSPIAHTAAAYAVYSVVTPGGRKSTALEAATPVLLAAAVILSLLPDLSSLAALFGGDLSTVHNNWEHSFMVALLVALVIGSVVHLRTGRGFSRWFWLAFACYSLHLIMDLFTVGRGVMLLWPFSGERFSPPFKLFYGLHWSDGWLSTRHWWTLLTETAFALVVIVLVRRRRPGAAWNNQDGKS
ncbi:MAG: metal-dependent hydrolase [Thermoanaerobaculia bacterium]